MPDPMSGGFPLDMPTLCFCILGFMLAAYAVLDGFVLGAGINHLGARDDGERTILLNSVGPVRGGNEAWLAAFGACFFAAFPDACAVVFSGFRLPLAGLLLALLLRAAAVAFRSRRPSPAWRAFWDRAFFGSSLAAALLLGAAAGNLVKGIPLDSDRYFAGTAADLLGLHPLLVGLLTAALFGLQGACWLCFKTEGPLLVRAQAWRKRWLAAVGVLYPAALAATMALEGAASRHLEERPWIWGLAAGGILVHVAILHAGRRDRARTAFLGSSALILLCAALFCGFLYPCLVPSSLDETWTLDVANAASPPRTLKLMAGLAAVGIPLALAYSAGLHRAFTGKVRLDRSSC